MAVSIGALGSVAWTTGANATLASTGVSNMEWNINMNGEDIDTTSFGSTGSMTAIVGLTDWTFDFNGYLLVPDHGGAGLVTYAAGTVILVNEWDMTIERTEVDSTIFTGATTVRTFIPGLFKGGGSFSGYLDNAASAASPVLPGIAPTPAAATFKYQEKGATDNNLSGTIFTKAMNMGARINAANPLSFQYRVSGDITQSTPSAGAGILPTGVLASTITDTLILKSDATRAFSGSAFWTSINISVRLGQATKVAVRGRGTGSLTLS